MADSDLEEREAKEEDLPIWQVEIFDKDHRLLLSTIDQVMKEQGHQHLVEGRIGDPRIQSPKNQHQVRLLHQDELPNQPEHNNHPRPTTHGNSRSRSHIVI